MYSNKNMRANQSFHKIYVNVSMMLTGMHALSTSTKMRPLMTTAFTTTPHYLTKVNSVHSSFDFFSTRPLFAASTEPVAPTISPDQLLMQDMLYRIRQVRHVPDDIRDSLLEFRVDGIKLGQVRPNIAKLLCSFNIDDTTNESNGAAFQMEWDDNSRSYLTLTAICGTTFESRSEAISKVTNQMKDKGIVTGWRDELFPVTATFYSEPVFAMERAAVSFLGVLEYGVHIVGVVKEENMDGGNELRMWMARRSATKSKWPSMMDHIAAGGQPIGLSLTENVVKECFEEAGIDETITRQGLRPAGVVTYENYVPNKDVVERIVLFCFDLYLPNTFEPKPVDGEVEQFYLYSMDQVLALMARDYPDPMKPNCYMVVIDFLIRHGYISPDAPGYLDIVRELRTGVCQ